MFLRAEHTFFLENVKDFKKRLLQWGQTHETVVFLDSNNYEQQYSSFDCVLAVDEFTSIKTDYFNAFEKLKEYQSYSKDYLFGYLSYDVKNDAERLSSNNYDGLDFPDVYFFQPQKMISIKGNEAKFLYLNAFDDEIEDDFESILGANLSAKSNQSNDEKSSVKIKLRIHKDEYFSKLDQVLKHIHRGDIYEANFCQEFYAENVDIDPYSIYRNLNAISEPPFATFFKHEELFLLSASPERYLRKEGSKIISQPIKGTAKRMVNAIEDDKIAFDLARDEKERSENIMIVDLVRNDLSRLAKKGSVKVEELCKVYPFKQVHQLISTVVSEINEDVHPVDVIRETFPMGSMTGAPKISAMEIIEKLEETKRGLYSGAFGYFTPEGDFDFNVVIRSILYNSDKKYVSYSVGGAITAKSVPEKEYEECLLKAKAMKQVLTQNTNSN
ncbi:aminodeoxychorismate synthase component I [Tenacibaculum jejuense]|uniref:aminodeoxychorismate synthase n=1 Tax=Tenacibaculum jejuense TaxID=584609 RepID=A0A238U823_9FLAO|nr:aminodeoxychorismate synthase component I [Tenacibaculum jejuense]SNR14644.1 Para-aminobenzoate synthase, component I [Tenacibaculum jejuense]